ncbi:MAG TPA: UrcA family protein [Steroidobacteraceae bacterium]|nr:UrcA family protein [Steroidobacteraceae bacterium]
MKSIKYLLPLVALAASGIAAASAAREAPGVVVRYGDLDLNSQAGVASLHKRIRNAAASVCSQLETRILGLHDAYDRCVKEALSNGVAAVANPNLSNFHASKGKGAVVASIRQ